MTNPKYLYWYQAKKSSISLPLFKTVAHRYRNREEETGEGKNRSVKSKKSQTDWDTDRQINHITESHGITGRSFVVFTSNSLHVVCAALVVRVPHIVLHLHKQKQSCCEVKALHLTDWAKQQGICLNGNAVLILSNKALSGFYNPEGSKHCLRQ